MEKLKKPTTMNTEKKIHFMDNNLLNATNPLLVNVIGAVGKGSKVLTGLIEMQHTLIALGHAALQIWL